MCFQSPSQALPPLPVVSRDIVGQTENIGVPLPIGPRSNHPRRYILPAFVFLVTSISPTQETFAKVEKWPFQNENNMPKVSMTYRIKSILYRQCHILSLKHFVFCVLRIFYLRRGQIQSILKCKDFV